MASLEQLIPVENWAEPLERARKLVHRLKFITRVPVDDSAYTGEEKVELHAAIDLLQKIQQFANSILDLDNYDISCIRATHKLYSDYLHVLHYSIEEAYKNNKNRSWRFSEIANDFIRQKQTEAHLFVEVIDSILDEIYPVVNENIELYMERYRARTAELVARDAALQVELDAQAARQKQANQFILKILLFVIFFAVTPSLIPKLVQDCRQLMDSELILEYVRCISQVLESIEFTVMENIFPIMMINAFILCCTFVWKLSWFEVLNVLVHILTLSFRGLLHMMTRLGHGPRGGDL